MFQNLQSGNMDEKEIAERNKNYLSKINFRLQK